MKLIVRVDADAAIGAGHFMRCLALAQRWKDAGGDTLFLMDRVEPWVRERLEDRMECAAHGAPRGSAQDARLTASFARKAGAEWVVLDGYGFDGGFQCALKGEGLRVLAVDDIGKAGHYAADIVLNVNVGVDASFYASREPYTRLLTGADYFLFRREFTDQAATERVNPSAAKKILVTLGGSDPNNVTEKVLHLLKTLDIKTLDVTLVLGGSNPHAASVEAAAKTALFPTCVVRNAGRLSEFMAASDLAVTSVGTTAWELAFMKTPACVVVSFDYQRPFAEKMGEKAFLHLGWWESLESGDAAVRLEELIGDKNARDLMSEAGRNQVDGKGADRVLREMLS